MINADGLRPVNTPMTVYDANNDVSLYAPGTRAVSFECTSPTRKLKVYDKKQETKSEKAGFIIKSMDDVNRIEYEISPTKEIKTYFGKTNLFEISQEDLEMAYHKLTEKLIKSPIEAYEKAITIMLEYFFEHIKGGKRHWIKNTVLTMVRVAEKDGIHIELSEEDLKRYTDLIPAEVVKTNRKYAFESLKKELRKVEDTGISLVKENEKSKRRELLHTLETIAGEEEQWIRYSCMTYEDELEKYVDYAENLDVIYEYVAYKE